MSWFSDAVDWVGDKVAGSSTGGISGWLDTNSSWLKPVVGAVTGGITQHNSDNTQKEYLDYLKEREQQNYQNSVDQINAYNQQLQANNAAAGARSAAARQNEANRMKAGKKANKVTQKAYKEILAMYAPYKNVADTLLPQMSQTYQNSLGLQNALAQYVSSPAQTAKLDAGQPSWNINVPLPDSIRIK